MKPLPFSIYLPLSLAASALNAAVVYTQGVTPNTYSRSDVDFGRLMADDFIVPSATTVLSVSWQGAYHPDGVATSPDNFTILFFPDVAGNPGSAPISTFTVGDNVNRQSAGFNFPVGNTFPVYDYVADIPGGMPIPANTTLWIAILNDAAGSREWGWATRFPDAAVLNPSRGSFNGGATWTQSWSDNTQTFTLHDTAVVPEPVSSGLLSLGGLLLAFSRRRVSSE